MLIIYLQNIYYVYKHLVYHHILLLYLINLFHLILMLDYDDFYVFLLLLSLYLLAFCLNVITLVINALLMILIHRFLRNRLSEINEVLFLDLIALMTPIRISCWICLIRSVFEEKTCLLVNYIVDFHLEIRFQDFKILIELASANPSYLFAFIMHYLLELKVNDFTIFVCLEKKSKVVHFLNY